jgi:23S rRNA (uridine2552-2'-O)-methyltransferase
MSLKSNYRDGDSFTRRSKKEGYRSRASYKLKELLQTDIKLLKGDSVLDLGSFPGGWSQVASEIVGKSGKVAAIDIQHMKPIEGCFFLKRSIEEVAEKDFEEIRDFLPFDLVLSDMAPNISGIRERDDALMMELVDKTLLIVDKLLKTKGSTLIKVFQGESLDYTREALSIRFNTVKISKPKASRSNSKEIYIIGKELKNYERTS